MQPEPMWPVGPTFYAEQTTLPPFPRVPEPTYPYRSWGRKLPTQVWLEAGRCHAARYSGAGVSPPGWGATVAAMQAHPDISNPWALAWYEHNRGYRPGGAGQGDAAWYAELIRDPHCPNVAKPYLERGEPPPQPGSHDYFEHIRPYFRYGRIQEQAYIDWWYSHFTTDDPGPRYTIPEVPTSQPASEPEPPEAPEAPAGPRPPRDWPAQEPAEPGYTPTTASETGAPWGWILGGGAALLLVGGGVAYVVTKPKRGKRSRKRTGKR